LRLLELGRSEGFGHLRRFARARPMFSGNGSDYLWTSGIPATPASRIFAASELDAIGQPTHNVTRF